MISDDNLPAIHWEISVPVLDHNRYIPVRFPWSLSVCSMLNLHSGPFGQVLLHCLQEFGFCQMFPSDFDNNTAPSHTDNPSMQKKT